MILVCLIYLAVKDRKNKVEGVNKEGTLDKKIRVVVNGGKQEN